MAQRHVQQRLIKKRQWIQRLMRVNRFSYLYNPKSKRLSCRFRHYIRRGVCDTPVPVCLRTSRHRVAQFLRKFLDRAFDLLLRARGGMAFAADIL